MPDYSDIKKITKTITVLKTIKPAAIKEEETGEMREVVILDKNNKRRVEERPITRRIEIPAVQKEVAESKEYFVVTDVHSGENHEFIDVESAQSFVKAANKARVL